MKDTRESLMKGKRWWYNILLWNTVLFVSLYFSAPVQADTDIYRQSALVIEQQQETTATRKNHEEAVSGQSDTQLEKKDSGSTSEMLQHVFSIVFAGVWCTALGIGVLVWHIRQDRADDAYIESVMQNHGELSVYRTDNQMQEKENYGGKTVFIRRKQV